MKTVLVVVAGLVVLLVAGVLIAPSFVDWNAYKGQIAAAVRDATGRELTIAGDIDLAVLPTPALAASQVRLASIPGAANPDMLSLEAMRVRISVGALLRGQIAVESVTLVKPVIALEVTEDGRANWQFETASASKGGAGRQPGSDSGGSPAAISLDSMKIEDGTVIYRDATADIFEKVEDLDAEISAKSLSGPFHARGEAVFQAVRASFDARAGRIAEGQSVPLSLTLGVPQAGGTLKFTGALSRAAADGTLDGHVVLTADNAAALLAALTQDAAPPVLAKPATLEGELTASAAAVDLNKMALSLGDTRANGAVNAALGDKPRVDVALSTNNLDLDALLAAAAPPDKAAKAATEQAGQTAPKPAPAAETPVESAAFALPNNLTATLDLTAKVVQFRNGLIQDAVVRASMADGAVQLQNASALLPGGSEVSIAGAVRPVDGKPRFEGRLDASSDNLRRALEWLGVAPATLPADRLRSFSYASKLAVTPDRVEVTEAAVRLDTSRIAAALTLLLRERPAFGLRVAVDRLNLDAYMAQDAPAKPAAADAAGPAGQAAPAKPAAEESPALAEALDAFDANIDLRVGGLTYRRTQARDLHLDLQVLQGKLTLREASLADYAGASGRISGTMAGAAGKPEVALDFDLKATDPERLFRAFGASSPQSIGALGASGHVAGSIDALKVEAGLRAFGGEAKIDGTVKTPLAAPAFDLGIGLDHPDLAKAIRIAAPDYRPAEPLGALAVSFHASGDPSTIAIRNLDGKAGPVSLAGSADLKLDGVRPALRLDLKTGEVAIARLLSAPEPKAAPPRRRGGAPAAGSAGAGGDGRWSRDPIDVSGLQAVDAELSLDMAALSGESYRLENPKLHAVLKDGTLTVDRLTGTLFGGALDGKATLATADKMPRLSAEIAVKDAEIGKATRRFAEVMQLALGPLSLSGQVAGPVSLNATLTTEGATEQALVAALDGKGSVAGELRLLLSKDTRVTTEALGIAGAILGDKVNELGILQQVTGATQRIAQAFGDRPSKLSGDFTVTDGVLRTDNTRLVNPRARAETKGSASLPAWRIDATTAIYEGEAQAPLVTATLTGPLDAPNVKTGGTWLSGQARAQPQQQQPQQQHRSDRPQPPKPEEIFKDLLRGLAR